MPHSRAQRRTGRAWVAAALLVLVSAIAVGLYLDQTALRVDQFRLERGAEAVNRGLEAEIGVLETAANVIVAAAAAADTPDEFASIAEAGNLQLLSSLVGLVVYPVTDTGTGAGDVFLQIHPGVDVRPPDLGLSAGVTDLLVSQGAPYLSPAYTESGTDGVRMVAVVPVVRDDQNLLVGAIFLADQVLERAVLTVGGDEYAASLVDARFGNSLITSVGTPTGTSSIQTSPVGMAGLVDVVVSAGSEFPYSRSPWIIIVSLSIGVILALLLLGLASLTKARTNEMDKRLELARQQDESKDRFLATVSHELRTPLTVVVGGASEIESRWDWLTPSDRKELLDMVVDQAQEASNLVEDLLVVARSEYGSVQIAASETGLQRHLNYAIESVPLDRRETLAITTEDLPVYADGTRLRQILRNLVHNALEHGGPNVGIEASLHGDVVHVSVFDDGPSVPVEERERIFEPYAQANGTSSSSSRGLGIGLYVSRLLARLMDGDLVCLRTGDRTEFRLTLPTPSHVEAEDRQPVRIG